MPLPSSIKDFDDQRTDYVGALRLLQELDQWQPAGIDGLVVPDDRHELERFYEKAIRFALRNPEQYAFMYDLWGAFRHLVAGRKLTRHFLIYLWDAWQAASKSGKVDLVSDLVFLAVFLGDEADLQFLPAFRAPIDFYPATTERPGTQRPVEDAVREQTLFAVLVEQFGRAVEESDGGTSAQAQTRLLYSLARLYGSLFPNPCGQKGLEALQKELKEAELKIQCRENELLDPSVGSEPAVKLFAWLYRAFEVASGGTAHMQSATVPLSDLASEALQNLPKSLPDDVVMLLKFWAARGGLWNRFLEHASGFRFTETPLVQAEILPAPTGCDIQVAVLGPRNVGKSSFLWALQDAGMIDVQPRPGYDSPRSIEPSLMKEADGGAKAATPTEVVAKWLVAKLKPIWAQGGPKNKAEEELWKTSADSTMGRSRPVNEVRFEFTDIPGEWFTNYLLALDGNAYPGQESLPIFFQRAQPVALVFLLPQAFSTKDEEDFHFRIIKETVRLAKETSAPFPTAATLPIYLVVNYTDLLLGKLRRDGNEAEVSAFEDYLSGGKEVAPGKRFYHVGAWWDRNRRCFGSLAYASQLREDLSRLREPLAWLKDSGFSNISLVYAQCSPIGGNWPSARRPVEQLWRDLTGQLRNATAVARRDQVRKEFVKNLRTEIGVLDELLQATDLVAFDDDQQRSQVNRMGSLLRGSTLDRFFETLGARADFSKAPYEQSGIKDLERMLYACKRVRQQLLDRVQRVRNRILDEIGIPRTGVLSGVAADLPKKSFASLPPAFAKRILEPLLDGKNPPEDRLCVGPLDSERDRVGILTTTCRYRDRPLRRVAAEVGSVVLPPRGAELPASAIDLASQATVTIPTSLSAVGPKTARVAPSAPRELSDIDEVELLHLESQGLSLEGVINRTMGTEQLRAVCRLFANFTAPYPRFAFRRHDRDRHKVETLTRFIEGPHSSLLYRFVQGEELLISSLIKLSSIEQKVEGEVRVLDQLADKLKPAYVFYLLRKDGFNAKKVVEDFDTVISGIDKLMTALEKENEIERTAHSLSTIQWKETIIVELKALLNEQSTDAIATLKSLRDRMDVLESTFNQKILISQQKQTDLVTSLRSVKPSLDNLGQQLRDTITNTEKSILGKIEKRLAESLVPVADDKRKALDEFKPFYSGALQQAQGKELLLKLSAVRSWLYQINDESAFLVSRDVAGLLETLGQPNVLPDAEPQIGTFVIDLSEYVSARKALVLEERIRYLLTTQWFSHPDFRNAEKELDLALNGNDKDGAPLPFEQKNQHYVNALELVLGSF